uniref:Uncharacterized protein n=1 Tax=Parascaris univalens TaxID=6257 RepID=A0A915BUK8_PARUN
QRYCYIMYTKISHTSTISKMELSKRHAGRHIEIPAEMGKLLYKYPQRWASYSTNTRRDGQVTLQIPAEMGKLLYKYPQRWANYSTNSRRDGQITLQIPRRDGQITLQIPAEMGKLLYK